MYKEGELKKEILDGLSCVLGFFLFLGFLVLMISVSHCEMYGCAFNEWGLVIIIFLIMVGLSGGIGIMQYCGGEIKKKMIKKYGEFYSKEISCDECGRSIYLSIPVGKGVSEFLKENKSKCWRCKCILK